LDNGEGNTKWQQDRISENHDEQNIVTIQQSNSQASVIPEKFE